MRLIQYEPDKWRETWVIPNIIGAFYYYDQKQEAWTCGGNNTDSVWMMTVWNFRAARADYIEEHLKWEVADGKA